MVSVGIVRVLFICACVIIMTSAVPLSRKSRGADMTPKEIATKYLTDMQFLGDKNPNDTVTQMEAEDPDLAFTEALKNAQRMYVAWNISVTGELDEETMKLMEKERCGNPDMVSEMMMRRKKRYLLSGGTWTKTPLTWKILTYPTNGGLSDTQVTQEIERAFLIWSKVSPLRFAQLAETDNTIADIEISFVEPFINHLNDGSPFDGPGGTLAHAFFPGQGLISGDSHFDNGEQWTINTYSGINLFQVAAHEFGHALGLGHSMVPEALMAPFYQGYVPDYQLPEDDILGIQAKYGTPVPSTTAQTTTSPATPEPLDPDIQDEMDNSTSDFCNSPSFDAVTTVLVGEDNYRTYAFKGDIVFLMENDGTIAVGYPRPINMVWPGLPNDIDAAVFWDAEYTNQWNFNYKLWQWELERTITLHAVTYVFKGDSFWQIDSNGVKPARNVVEWRMPGGLESIDTVFKWGATGFTYFTSGNQYWAYSEETNRFLPGYPRSLSNWGSFQGSVDGAFHSYVLDQLVFFSGDKFYPFNDATLTTAVGYPQDIVPQWVRCPEPLLDETSTGRDQINGAAYVHLSLHTVSVAISACTILIKSLF